MTYTASSLILKVRDLISDSVEDFRWSDEVMLDWLNEAVAALFENHPEFFYVGSVVLDPPDPLTLVTETLSTTQTGQKIMINYVCYRCLSRDNEDPETMQMARQFLEVYGMGL